jgi:3alpha(or 20beta)-hydroxysteroid dehydrogenase
MAHVAMNRVGEAIEIANLAVFLTSDESSFSTGAEFIADGGETAGLIRHDGSPAGHAVSGGR